ncbi:VanZ family protein [Capnocytophaga sp.]|uniref:VanZ family protein n=1 Tax=Capnocytophaga sp. TaxID=44737 RepID=UPI0034C64421
MPANEVSDLPRIPHLDKLAHFTFYFVFTILFFLTLKYECKYVKKVVYFYTFSFIAAFLLGISLEVLQKITTSTRSGEFLDVLFNTFGTVVALLFVKIIDKKLLINVK